jgi:hypothetical protein
VGLFFLGMGVGAVLVAVLALVVVCAVAGEMFNIF